jgi:hypothetical protein
MVKSLFSCALLTEPKALSRVFVVAKDNQQYRAVYARMVTKQDGRCSHCKAAINNNDTIVSKAYVRKSKYFHKVCAERVHIL